MHGIGAAVSNSRAHYSLVALKQRRLRSVVGKVVSSANRVRARHDQSLLPLRVGIA